MTLSVAELDAAMRDLVRNIERPQALRHNPLVARALHGVPDADQDAAITRVRAVALAALQPGSRQAEIVRLCDVEGIPHKVAQKMLGLSRRQFYRERSAARSLILAAVTRRPAATVLRSRIEATLEHVETLYDFALFGRIDEALAACELISQDGAVPDLLVHTEALRAVILSESGEFEKARIAREGVHRLAGSRSAGLAELAYANGYAAFSAGEHTHAVAAATHAVQLSRTGANATDRERRAHARHLALLGSLLSEDHDPAASLAVFMRARDTLLACSNVPQSALVHAQVDIASRRIVTGTSAPGALDEAVQALDASARHGLSSARIWSTLVLGYVYLTLGNRAQVMASVRSVHALARFVDGGAWLARIYILVSRLERACGMHHEALRSVRRAQDTLPPGHYLAGIADVRAAEALIGLDEPEKALEHADAALERSIGFRESHFTGAAHIVKAKALQSIGRVADAVEHCDAGLERLRRGGLLHDLQRALELAASLTGETRYLAEAGEVAFSMSAV
ncbi:MAG TPA: hypothetical protein VGX96_06150 [Candidatus Elarobacter sp.]|nr:hypothetical protein [Candidatus Elarobacter sp.]